MSRKTHLNYPAVALVCAGLLAGVTGCTSEKASLDGMSAEEIGDTAVKTMKDVQSLRIVTEGQQNGKPVTMDVTISKPGTCTSTMNLPSTGTVRALTVDQVSYTKGNSKYMTLMLGSPESAAKAKGLWVKAPKDQNGDTENCMIATLFKSSDLKGAKRGADSEAEGQKTITLVKKDKGRTTTVHIAREGKPYTLKTVVSGTETSSTTFSGFNKKFKVTAPAPNEMVESKDLLTAGPTTG